MREASGQVLVETMVALSMTVIGLIGILMVLNTSIGLNRVITNQYIASYLASEGIELAGYQLDVNVFSSQPYQAGFQSGLYVVTAGTNGLELTRFSSNTTWTTTTILALPTTLVYSAQDSSGHPMYLSYLTPPPNPSPTPYHRVVVVTTKSADEVMVNSVVVWITKGGVAMSVNVEDHFYNWRKP